MILATHALVGAAIGEKIKNPWLVAVLSVAFHYALDMIKHGEYVETMDNKTSFKNTWWKVSLDIALAFTLIFLIFIFQKPDYLTSRNIIIGVFFSMLPDSLTLAYWKFRWKFLEKIYQFHAWCHCFPRLSPEREWNFRNETYEIIIIFVALIAIIFI